ncbi:MAG TPA: hypothetical protein EYQ00_05450 [Dehalococcoidia bacterium]|jgi:hypothetical protein|nr:hypothetical protein [Dehalococcoidia bacterium]
MILVNSFGGCATTTFTKQLWNSFFRDHTPVAPMLVYDDGLSIANTDKLDCRGLKHTNLPPSCKPIDTRGHGRHYSCIKPGSNRRLDRNAFHSGTDVVIDRAVYLYVNPIKAVTTFLMQPRGLSMINQEVIPWPVGHAKNLGGDWRRMNTLLKSEEPEGFNDMVRLAERARALGVDDEIKVQPGLNFYCEERKDLFGLEKHFDNWTTGQHEYPILAVKYETMWEQENIRKIAHFLDLDGRFINNFPQKRARTKDIKDTPSYLMTALKEIHSSLIEKMEAAPPCMLNGEEYAHTFEVVE